MYFAVSWSEPRLRINQTAAEWTEARTGPTNVGVLCDSWDRNYPVLPRR